MELKESCMAPPIILLLIAAQREEAWLFSEILKKRVVMVVNSVYSNEQ